MVEEPINFFQALWETGDDCAAADMLYESFAKHPEKFAISCKGLDKILRDYKLNIIPVGKLKHSFRIKVYKRGQHICTVWYDDYQLMYEGDFNSLPKKLKKYLECIVLNCWGAIYDVVTQECLGLPDAFVESMILFKLHGCKETVCNAFNEVCE